MLKKAAYLGSLPPAAITSSLPEIQMALADDRRKIVVLDDDPTGTQTVHGIPVLTDWSVDVLEAELSSAGRAFYILTNSRSLPQDAAQRLNREIAANLVEASTRTGQEFVIISRSDSTLRGHYPAECDALSQALKVNFDATVIVPFFIEGGRYTINDIHYVAEHDALIPAAETPFAADAVFGYRQSNLREWVAEKTQGRVAAEDVVSISLDDIRVGGVAAVQRKVDGIPTGGVCIVNAASYRDLETVVLALLHAEAAGKRYLYRTAASFVRARAGIAPVDLLTPAELSRETGNGGLVVVGSYVPKTTAQLRELLKLDHVCGLEVDVNRILQGDGREGVISDLARRAVDLLRAGKTAVVYSSRELITSRGAKDQNLNIGAHVSNALVDIVRAIDVAPRFLIAKGGITSSDVATRGLGVKRALVLGQVLPGVPVWQLGDESSQPGMRYIVFPGNVGDESSLAQIVGRLQAKEA